MPISKPTSRTDEAGNVIFFVLLAIFLLALVTAALRVTGGGDSTIDREQTALQASEIKQYAAQLERGVIALQSNGVSENDLRFAHPDADPAYGDIGTIPANQLFNSKGGDAAYQTSPVATGQGAWEFTGQTHMPSVGSNGKGDLIAVLPNVSAAICKKLNALDGFDPATTPTGCPFTPGGRFTDATHFRDSSPGTMTESSFSSLPATEACTACTDGKFYFYRVLIAR